MVVLDTRHARRRAEPRHVGFDAVPRARTPRHPKDRQSEDVIVGSVCLRSMTHAPGLRPVTRGTPAPVGARTRA
jgi:hypothetical protein